MVVKKNKSGVLELFITKKRNWFSRKLLNNFGSNMAGTLKHTMEGLSISSFYISLHCVK